MDNSVGAHIEPAEVRFFPPLHEQRRSWALEIIRRERVTSVLDVGCGEGILLQHLTHTPPWRAHTPSTPAPPVVEKTNYIHVRGLHGLDISHDDLSYAVSVTKPANHAYGWTRFEELDVSIWEGELQAPNAAFKDIECIVATEVVEHLPEDVLDTFAPTLLGNYSPRLLLLTTPSFDFNARFRAPGDESWGFPDPTGRTNRTFRHDDHKFEWTVDECTDWCQAAAQEWGYEVIISGLGRSITKDPWGRDSDTVRATQAITFRRREGDEWAIKRRAKYAEWAASKEEGVRPHQLLATHRHEAHTSSQKLASREEIVTAVKTTIRDICSSDVTIFELWREDSISTLCGGWLEVLLDVLNQDESFVVHKKGNDTDDWRVELPGVELRGSPWQSAAKQDDDAWGESSDTTDTTGTYEDEEYYDEEYYNEEYDEENVAECEEWSTEGDINSLKAWEEWKPAPGWLVESSCGWD